MLRNALGGLLAASLLLSNLAAAPALPEIARSIVEASESTWKACAEPPGNISSRTLFAYAFALCEARQHPERLERLFDLAARMQDRDPKSKTFGNFHWKWSDATVMDGNAVDFCMRGGSLLWLKHRDFIPPAARAKLKELLEFSVKGCLGHRVAESYSNIAIMNAGDLILLGEALGKPEEAAEGYTRLDRVCLYTYEAGIHEFDSPTYTGTDLDGLVMIEAFCQSERGRAQARALLELLWTDIALNWFPPVQKLAGAHSRTYDYIHGLGYLDVQLQLNDWLPAAKIRDLDAIFGAQAKWHPPTSLRELSTRFPRLLRQRWGTEPPQNRTHYLLPDVTLSSLGAAYGGRMDMPLTVDFPGSRESVRVYFIADGRDDPYGKKKIAAGTHQKAFHLSHFWTAVQRRSDALALTMYRNADITEDATTLGSNFVMPMDGEIWVGEQKVTFDPKKASRLPVKAGEPVTIKKGSAAASIRVAWARGLDGSACPAALVFDGNKFGAVRLVVEHVPAGNKPAPGKTSAGAAFWVRIGNGLNSETALANWRKQFAAARAEVDAKPDHVQVRAESAEGPLLVSSLAPWTAPDAMEPAPTSVVLEQDGTELAKKMLQNIEPMKSMPAQLARSTVKIPAGTKGIYFEAETAALTPDMAVGSDSAAQGGKFVWVPAPAGVKSPRTSGSATWNLEVEKTGTYYLWGRVLTPSPDNDSFFASASTRSRSLQPAFAWQPGVHKTWTWVPLNLEKQKEPAPLAFPAGEVRFEVRVREAGSKLDKLFLTADPKGKPE